MNKKILFIMFSIILCSCSIINDCGSCNEVSIIPYLAIHNKKGSEAYLDTSYNPNKADTVGAKKDIVANYLFDGCLQLSKDTIIKHLSNFLDTVNLYYHHSNAVQINFYKTSSITNKNFRGNGVDGYIPTEDRVADIAIYDNFIPVVGSCLVIINKDIYTYQMFLNKNNKKPKYILKQVVLK